MGCRVRTLTLIITLLAGAAYRKVTLSMGVKSVDGLAQVRTGAFGRIIESC